MAEKDTLSSEGPNAPKTVHICLGFFFIVNFCLGTGFLGVPYSFYYSGYLAAIPSLLVISFVSWVNATYVVECMARAQALDTLKESSSNRDSVLGSPQRDVSIAKNRPNFQITIYRKFEQVEMCELFYGKWMKYLYLLIFTVYSFLALWSFSTVAGSAWASNIPFNFTTIKQCTEDGFQHDALPSDPNCQNAYHLCLSIFGVFVILLSLFDLKEQAIVQMILGLMRFITVLAIIIYCLVNLFQHNFKNKCRVDSLPSFSNETHNFDETSHLIMNATHILPVRIFDVPSWLSAIPVFTYAFILHQGIPSLTHPIRQKQYMRYLIIAMFVTAGVCYFSLGIFVSLWFDAYVQETCTLNWGLFTGPSSSLGLRILSYYIILFPSLDVVSAYPLLVHTVVVNIYMIITGKDTSKKPSHRFAKLDWLLRLTLRFLAALLPILMAFGVANLIIVLKFAGLFGFAICFGFPTALQLRSIYVCKKKFADCLVDTTEYATPVLIRKEPLESTPLLSVQQPRVQDTRALYMTPYSSKLLSHPITVCVIGLLGVCVFLLTFSSLFVPQNAMECYTGLDFDEF